MRRCSNKDERRTKLNIKSVEWREFFNNETLRILELATIECTYMSLFSPSSNMTPSRPLVAWRAVKYDQNKIDSRIFTVFPTQGSVEHPVNLKLKTQPTKYKSRLRMHKSGAGLTIIMTLSAFDERRHKVIDGAFHINCEEMKLWVMRIENCFSAKNKVESQFHHGEAEISFCTNVKWAASF